MTATTEAGVAASLIEPPVGVGVIGAGIMGAFDAASLAQRIRADRPVGVADPLPGVADWLATSLLCPGWTLDCQQLLADARVEAVVIAPPARCHAEALLAAAQAGTAVLCESPSPTNNRNPAARRPRRAIQRIVSFAWHGC